MARKSPPPRGPQLELAGDLSVAETEELEEIESMLAEQAPTWTEMWKQEGRREGESTLLLLMLERRFGLLDEHTRQRVQEANAEQLLEWGNASSMRRSFRTSSATTERGPWNPTLVVGARVA